jgi:capsular polysaccharide biosynthesis protein
MSLIKKLKNKENINIGIPKNFREEDWKVKKYYRKYECSSVYIFSFLFSFITSDSVIFNLTGIKKQFMINDYFKEKYNLKYILNSLKTKRIKYCSKPLISIFDEWSSFNFYHFIFSGLERLELALEIINKEKIFIPLPYNCPLYVLEGIQVSGIDESQIYYVKKDEIIFCKKIYILNYANNANFPFPDIALKVSSQLIMTYNKSVSTSHYIYISRKNAKKRRIINEEELTTLLRHYKFDIIYTEQLSLADQVAIFKNAHIVISSHGAGLSNIIFMNKKNTVLEINTNNLEESNTLYNIIAQINDLDYYYISASSDAQDNYIVPIDEIQSTLNSILTYEKSSYPI